MYKHTMYGALGGMGWPFTIVSAQPLSVSFAVQ